MREPLGVTDILSCEHECYALLVICVPHADLRPAEARRGFGLRWSYHADAGDRTRVAPGEVFLVIQTGYRATYLEVDFSSVVGRGSRA